MMGNEYIAHELEGVPQARGCRMWGSGVDGQSAMGDLMTHLWLRVTQGSGPLKEEPATLATSEHM